MRVGLYQSHPTFGKVRENIQKVESALSTVKADLMVLPELFNTGYQFLSRDEIQGVAEEIPSGMTCRAMTSLAKAGGMFVVFGLAERCGRRVYNSAAVVGPQGYMGRYRKTHLFAEETIFFDPGDTGFRVFDVGRAKIGVMICFDWLFPESARVLALRGAQIICHPSNLVLAHCQRAMITRSLENGVFSITANRIGSECRGGKAPLSFTGRSQIVDHSGQVLSRLGEGDEGVLLADVDPGRADEKRITAQNDRLRDRRPEFYSQLTGITQ